MARKNILVVDDEKAQREILELILTDEGYDVTTAASGEAAIKFAKDRRFDLALTDLKMTGMDGIELLQHLLAFDSSIIVILLTKKRLVSGANLIDLTPRCLPVFRLDCGDNRIGRLSRCSNANHCEKKY